MHAPLPEHPHYMPILLKGLLAQYGIRRADLAAAILAPNGKPISETAVSQIINWGSWPKTTPRQAIVAATEALLRAKGVPEEALATMWQTAGEEDVFRYAQPAGIHAGPVKRRAEAVTDPDIDPIGEREMLSPTAKKHFALFRDPFVDDVQGPDDIFLDADQRYIREAMYSTARHGGFLAVVGESGAGKTVLRRDLIDRIARENASILVIQPRTIDKGVLTAGAICEAIIDDLTPGASIRRSLEGKARQVERLLRDSSRAGNTHVLLIEEAHDLSVPTLKYLKRFWELEDGFRKLLSIILVGQPELKLRLDERHNPEAREVIRRCEVAELRPLDGNLEAYLALKFKRVGKEVAEIIDRDSYDAIRARLSRPRRGPGTEVISQMYPLIVNNLTVKAMNLAAELGAPKVGPDLVREL